MPTGAPRKPETGLPPTLLGFDAANSPSSQSNGCEWVLLFLSEKAEEWEVKSLEKM